MLGFYNIKNSWKISRLERMLIIKGIFIAIFVSFLLRFVSLKKVLSFLRLDIDNNPNIEENIRLMRKSIRRIRLVCPCINNCLIRSITSKAILNDLGIKSKIVLSIQKQNGCIYRAHASLLVNNYHIFENSNFSSAFIID